MDISRQACRLCLSITDFNISLFSSYCEKCNMLDKILVCLKLIIEKTDYLTTICYKCADNVERYYDFITFVKKSQTKLKGAEMCNQSLNNEPNLNITRRHVTSYVREVIDADYTFSFLDISKNEDKKESNTSSPFFSYFSPPNMLVKPSVEPCLWKTRARSNDIKNETKSEPLKNELKRCRLERPRHHSIDLFESQSQDVEETELRSLDWKLTPDESLFKRVRDKCFGRSDF